MNWECLNTKRYYKYLNEIIDERGQWFNFKDEYYEIHHIIMRSYDGDNDKNNLIYLTAKEHYIAHQILAEDNPDEFNCVSAWHMMAYCKSPGQDRYLDITAEEYETLKKLWSLNLKNSPTNISNLMRGKHPWNYGKRGTCSSSKKIYLYDKDFNLVQIFVSKCQASRELCGIDYKNTKALYKWLDRDRLFNDTYYVRSSLV